ncbi:hypothetical protein V6O07_13540, partial [Arthrospira platensis SPKY2]
MRAMMLKSSSERFLQGVKAYETFRDQGGPGGREFTYLFERMLAYLVTRLEIVDIREVENKLNTIEDSKTRSEIMNLAQKLRHDGIQRGIQIGEQRGEQRGIQIGEQRGIQIG